MVSDARRHAVMVPPWVRDALWARARAVPSLDLDFAGSRSLVDRISGQQLITFTRASSATVINATGAIETVGNDVPRFQHDPATGRCLGLLVEEQRQNLLLNSATLSTQSVTSAATAYTLSFYGTGTITLTGTSTAGPLVGTGANARVSLTFTPTAGTLTLTVSGSVTNANLEAGSFATSWIPTTGTAATRSADIATVIGTNFHSWYRQGIGTLYAAYQGTEGNAGRRVATLSTATPGVDAVLLIGSNNAGTIANHAQVTTSSVVQAFLADSQSWDSTPQTAALSFAANDFAFSKNGIPALTDNAGTVPTVDQLSIGSTATTTQYLRGTISRLVYWPTNLPASVIQRLTRQ